MNLVIALVIIICLMISEMTVPIPVDDVWRRIVAVLLTMMVVPGLAVFQVFVFKGRIRQRSIALSQQNSILSRISACHAAIWLTASLAIVWAVQWQNVVRGNWKLDGWPLLDEFVIMLPIVLSLVASWAIFYEIQKSLRGDRKSSWRDRLKYVSLRFRIYVVIVVVPIAGMILLRDLWQSIDSLTSQQGILLTVATLVGLLAVFPLVMLWVWRNRQFENPAVKKRLLSICQQHKMRVSNIRVWETGNEIINALVAGVFPYFRVVLLSDGLLRSFPRHEIEAIIRHEAGHIRMGHLPTRITFVLLPIFAMGCAQFVFGSTRVEPLSLVATINSGTVGIDLLGIVSYVVYVLVVIAWLSRNMEYEADLYAIGAFDRRANDIRAADESEQLTISQSMADALLRFAQYHPDQFNRRSWTHPSLLQRIDVITRAVASPNLAIEIRKRFVRRQLALGCLVLIAVPILMLALRCLKA